MSIAAPDLNYVLIRNKDLRTLPFMPNSLLFPDVYKNWEHDPCDDLESVLYVLIWMCVARAAPEKERVRRMRGWEPRVGPWIAPEYQQSGDAKLLHIITFKFDLPLDNINMYYDQLKPLVMDVLFVVESGSRGSISVDDLYTRVISVFNAARDTLPPEPFHAGSG